MKVIIAGSRGITDYQEVKDSWESSHFITTEVVSGGARGVDRLGEQLAEELKIPCKKFIPDWDIGKHAGFIRNGYMAEYADALVACWDGKSKGTKNMIDQMKKLDKPVYVEMFDD